MTVCQAELPPLKHNNRLLIRMTAFQAILCPGLVECDTVTQNNKNPHNPKNHPI